MLHKSEFMLISREKNIHPRLFLVCVFFLFSFVFIFVFVCSHEHVNRWCEPNDGKKVMIYVRFATENHFKMYIPNGWVHVVGATPSKKTKESNQQHTELYILVFVFEEDGVRCHCQSQVKKWKQIISARRHIFWWALWAFEQIFDVICVYGSTVTRQTPIISLVHSTLNFHLKIFGISRDFN